MRSAPLDLVDLAARYAGQWVAMDEDGSVVASGASAREVLLAAEAQGVEVPLILEVVADYGSLIPCLT